MKDLFDETTEEVEKVKETGRTETPQNWWVGRTCSFCNEINDLWVSGNGLIRCKKHIRNS